MTRPPAETIPVGQGSLDAGEDDHRVRRYVGEWSTSSSYWEIFQQRGIDDRAGFFIGGIGSSAETTVQVNSDAGIGSTILLERLFNLPRKHRLDVRYLAVSSSGTNTLMESNPDRRRRRTKRGRCSSRLPV